MMTGRGCCSLAGRTVTLHWAPIHVGASWTEIHRILKPRQGKTWKEATDSIFEVGCSVDPYATLLHAYPSHGDYTRKLRSDNVICMGQWSPLVIGPDVCTDIHLVQYPGMDACSSDSPFRNSGVCK
jgi:hypothetical protein